ncbi:hypothetical protein OH77DRAFT_1494927 [Trametes cingulata]|nr:hypothetical protein OH77DRAFT_1494927 [Trametes cingulata]
MRLLHTATGEFVWIQDPRSVRYAILSHVWAPGGEQSYQHLHMTMTDCKATDWNDEIRRCSAYALREGYQSSSAEFTDAINSMYKWCQLAAICYAYLEDVRSAFAPHLDARELSRRKLFTRGWTLQELIAPGIDNLDTIVEHIIGIGWASLDSISVARRMSWACGRQTSKEEDEAYALLGIFGVYLPTIYGEGGNPFSLFAYSRSCLAPPGQSRGGFAPST